MKKKISTILLFILLWVLIYIALPKQQFVVQYLDNCELKTETYNNRNKSTERHQELTNQGYKVWVERH